MTRPADGQRSTMTAGPLRIFLVAGEASGDALGGRLMAALKECTDQPTEFRGIGGEAMTAAGLQSLFPMSELSVMGVSEVLPKARALFRRMRQTADAAHAFQPHAIVTIDAEGIIERIDREVSPMTAGADLVQNLVELGVPAAGE